MTIKLLIPVENYCKYCGEHLGNHKEEDCRKEIKSNPLKMVSSRQLRPERSPIEIPFLHSVRKITKGKKVIELGSAMGDLCRGFSFYSESVVGLEKGTRYIRIARQRKNNDYSSFKNIHYVKADFQKFFKINEPSKDFSLVRILESLVGDVYYMWNHPKKLLDFLLDLNNIMLNSSYKEHFPKQVTVLTPFFIEFDCKEWVKSRSFKNEISKFGTFRYHMFDEIIYFKNSEENFNRTRHLGPLSEKLKKYKLTQVGVVKLPTTESKIRSLWTKDRPPKLTLDNSGKYLTYSED